jgi:hypothetical protein
LRRDVQYPLSRDEHAAIARHLGGIRRHLQEISDLFSSRYGKDSSIAEMAVKALVSTTLLEHELTLLHDSGAIISETDDFGRSVS